MKISDFINNWLRPEVKFLIFQYTISTHIKSELNKVCNERKKIQYKWIRFEYSWRLQTSSPTLCLYVDNPTKRQKNFNPLKPIEPILEEESNGLVYTPNKKLLLNK
jgi:hypothetical protein|tara:strand:- start:428 stop:745 length:318 start_codon:yes stop_codon:yes gene_type:complete